MRFRALSGFVLGLVFSSAFPALAQSGSATTQPHMESTQELLAKLTPEQQQQFEAAARAASAQHFAEALASFQQLLKQLPNDPVLSKFAAENAINEGNTRFALDALLPIAKSDPDDWQAAALLVRAHAESNDTLNRDAGMTHMVDLHKRGITPTQMQQYIVERAKSGNGSVLIFTSLAPWGHYQVYNYAQIFDSSNRIILRATLESNDGDQPLFAKQHPDKASAGLRGFSLDGYKDTGLNNSNQKTETHFTFKFFKGQPSDNTVREEFIDIASGKTKPISSRVNVVGQ